MSERYTSHFSSNFDRSIVLLFESIPPFDSFDPVPPSL